MVGIFTPEKLANVTNQGYFFLFIYVLSQFIRNYIFFIWESEVQRAYMKIIVIL